MITIGTVSLKFKTYLIFKAYATKSNTLSLANFAKLFDKPYQLFVNLFIMNKIHVYFMPGMGASPKIFDRISLPEDLFELHYLEWLEPQKKESLSHYVNRIKEQIQYPNPVLIGVSFGGIIVQELEHSVAVRQTIIISSVRSHREFSKRLNFTKLLRLYKIAPTYKLNQLEQLILKFGSGKSKRRLAIFNTYMSVRSPQYLDWAFESILNWKQEHPNPNIIHIQGSKDEIFPVQYLKKAIIIKGGTHAIILTHAHQLNQILPELILNNHYETNP